MRKKMYFVALALLGLLLLSCNNKGGEQNLASGDNGIEEEDTSKNITGITALYYNYIFESEEPVKPEDVLKDIPQFGIDRKGILDAEITDSLKLAKIQILLDSLTPLQNVDQIDARIVATINYSNGSKDILCIGGEYSDKIYLNGAAMQTDNKLLFTVKNYIGFYPWIIGDDMFRMAEMKDNSFAKEPFVSSAYYKEYQAVLAER